MVDVGGGECAASARRDGVEKRRSGARRAGSKREARDRRRQALACRTDLLVAGPPLLGLAWAGVGW